MVRSTRLIELIIGENLLDNARRQGELLQAGLHDLVRRFPARLSQVRGRGLMIAFDLPDPETRQRLVTTAREHGLLLLPCGARSIRFRPFLDITRADAEKAIELLGRALSALT